LITSNKIRVYEEEFIWDRAERILIFHVGWTLASAVGYLISLFVIYAKTKSLILAGFPLDFLAEKRFFAV